jgi:hypothetical protein
MENSLTKRGFEISEFEDTSGLKCSLQMSSSAMEERIWLGVSEVVASIMARDAQMQGIEVKGPVEGWVDYPIPSEVLVSTRMHLNREQVAELIPYLQRFVDEGRLHDE